MKRKNPSLSPVFVVNTRPIAGRKNGIPLGFQELEDAYRKGEIRCIRIMDFSGRIIGSLNSPKNALEYSTANGGLYFLSINCHTGEVIRIPFFGQRQ